MKKTIEENIKSLDKNNSPNEILYNSLLDKVDFTIDKDFLDLIKAYNGMEGNLSEDNYVLFWNIEDLIALNPYYEDVKECDSLFFFGSNGSNLGYAFDKKNKNIIAIDFLDIVESQPEVIANSFESFIEKLS